MRIKPSHSKSSVIGALKLLTALSLVTAIVLFVIPLINRTLINDSVQKIKARGIDTGSLFYTESETAMKANFMLMKTKSHRKSQ